MVDAGRVLFQVGIDRASTDRAIADLERRLASVGDIDLRIDSPNLSTALGDIEQRLNGIQTAEIRIDTTQAEAKIDSLEASLRRLSANDADQELEGIERKIRDVGDAAQDTSSSTGGLNSALSGLAAGAAFAVVDRLVDAFGALTGKVTEFVAASIQANAQLRNTENALTILLGSNEAAAESIQFLRDTSERTGQSFSALQDNYAGITAAAKEFGLPQEAVNELFAETSRVLGIFGKSSAESGLAFNALTQIFAKGQVSLEELRQQLGEQLPVALSAAANGLKETGVLTQGTTSELLDLISTGLDAATFAEGFTAGLKQIEGEAPAAQQAIASLENAVLEFQQQLGKSLEPLETAFSETFAAIFREVDPNALDPLTAAGERLKLALADNPELAERLGEALTNFIGSGAEAVAEILDRITQALSNPDNVEAFADGIENAGQTLQQLVTAGIAAADILVTIGSAYAGIVAEEAVIATLRAFASLLSEIASISGDVAEGLTDIADGIARITDFSSALEGTFIALGSVNSTLGATTAGLNAIFNQSFEAPVVETSQFVPQQDELDKAVRAARDSNEQIASDAERAAKRAAAERAKVDKEAAKAFEEANKDALANIEIAQQNRIAAVRQNQAAGNITETEAESQISTIETEAIRERIALREAEIAQVEDFASRSAISEKDAAQQIRSARQEIADLTLEGIEQEISAQEAAANAARERIDKEVAAQEDAADAAREKAEEVRAAALSQLDAQQRLNDLQAEQVSIQSNIASTALQDQSNLIGAQVGLEQSRLSLSRQNLEGKLAEAEAAEDVLAVEVLRDRILINQRQSIAAEFNARRQQLGIQQQLTQLDADRQLKLGQIAEAEARIAVQRSQTDNASASEVSALQDIARLREQETDALESQARSKRDILSLQLEQLNSQEQLAEQQALQERREQAIRAFKEQQKDLADEQLKTEQDLASATEDRARAADSLVSSLSGLNDVTGDDALETLDQLERNLRSARRSGGFGGQDAADLQRAIDQAQRFARSGDGFSIDEAFRFANRNENNLFAGGVLDAVGLGGVSSFLDAQQEIAIADAQIEQLTTKLDEVRDAISTLPEELPPTAQIENLNVSSPDPVSDAAEIALALAGTRLDEEGLG
ncbi:MAG: tape measure protein [Cyanobacteria bacterium J06634_6]